MTLTLMVLHNQRIADAILYPLSKLLLYIGLGLVICFLKGSLATETTPPSQLKSSINSSTLSSSGNCYNFPVSYCIVPQKDDGTIDLPDTTDYWQSVLAIGDDGVPYFKSPEGKRYYNMATIAFSIFGRNQKPFELQCKKFKIDSKQFNALQFVKENTVSINDQAIKWNYNYETNINDTILRPPWASAFSQAALIERLLLEDCKNGTTKNKKLILQAARAFAIPVTKGGLRSESDKFVWFQEVPLPDKHNPYIFNAHLYAIRILFILDRLFPGERFGALAEAGLKSALSVLEVIDTDYWNRYDLRPRYHAVNLRIDGPATIKSVTMTVEGKKSYILFSPITRKPSGNAFWGNSKIDEQQGGVVLDSDKLMLQMILPVGRDFDPAMIRKPISLEVVTASSGHSIKLSTLSARPGEVEFFKMDAKSTVRRDNGLVYSYDLHFHDFNWGQTAKEYVPFHADQISIIGKLTRRNYLVTLGVRWAMFYQRFLNTPPQAGLVRQRTAYKRDLLLESAVSKAFVNYLPTEIRAEQVKSLVERLYKDKMARDAALMSLGLCEPPGCL